MRFGRPREAAAPVFFAAPECIRGWMGWMDGMVWMVKAKHARFLWWMDGVDVVDVVGVSDGEAARFAKAREKKIFCAKCV